MTITLPAMRPVSTPKAAALSTLLILVACGSVPQPEGTVRMDGGMVQVHPDVDAVELAPFWVDPAPAQEGSAPVVRIRWAEARQRCAARGMRLPTDAEWQLLAARETPPPEDSVFQWTETRYTMPPDRPQAPELHGDLRVVRGACCPFMPGWSATDHRAVYPEDRPSSQIGYRCATPVRGGADSNLMADALQTLPHTALDEGEAVRQLLAGLYGPDRAPTDPDVRALLEGLEPGATVADIGCGLGALSLEIGRAVGPEGRVYAVDVNDEVLGFTQRVAQQQGVAAVRTVKGTPTDSALPPESCDLILLYDMLASPRPDELPGFVASLVRALAPGGRLVVFQKPGPPPPARALAVFGHQGLQLQTTVNEQRLHREQADGATEKLWVFERP